MFGKSNNTRQLTQEIKSAENEAISSMLDQSVQVIGNIDFQGKIRIDGIVEGNINGEHLVLSENGHIHGDVCTSSFNCYGTIKGIVRAEIVNARKGCHISGEIHATALTVEPGACIMGEIKSAVPAENREKLLPETETSSEKSVIAPVNE